MIPNYLNTDLDIHSQEDLSLLARELEKHCDLLHAGQTETGEWFLRVEARGSGVKDSPNHSPETDTANMLAIIEMLEPTSLSLLSRATKIEFNIGLESIESFPEQSFTISPELLSRIAQIGAKLGVTVYPKD